MNFRSLMEILQDEDEDRILDLEIPPGFEKAGWVTPTGLMRIARCPGDQEMDLRLEVISKVMDNVDQYLRDEVMHNAELMAEITPLLGRPVGGDEKPLELQDFIKVRISWRAELVGTKLNTVAWYNIIPALERKEDTGQWVIRWPERHDEEAQYWPMRFLREAQKFALFTRGLRGATCGAITPLKP